MGDLNSDLLYRGRTTEESYLGRHLQRILSTYRLKCVIKELTRITENVQTLIDLITVSNPDKVTNTGVSHLGISDHSLVYANVRMRKEKQQLITKTVKNYSKLDTQSFKADIESAPWSVCEVFYDLNDHGPGNTCTSKLLQNIYQLGKYGKGKENSHGLIVRSKKNKTNDTIYSDSTKTRKVQEHGNCIKIPEIVLKNL